MKTLRKIPLGRLPSRGVPVVYCVRGRRLIKIGTSIDAAERVKKLGEPVELVGWAVGDRRTEQWVHRVLEEHRVHGEWFRPSPVVLHVVRHLKRIVRARHRAMTLGIYSWATNGQMERLWAELSKVTP